MKLLFTLILISSQILAQQKAKDSNDSLSKKYLQEINSPYEQTRLNAAKGLYDIKDPNAIEALIKTINDGEDRAHFNITPSVTYLTQIGKKALLLVLELMLSEDANTRLRALTAIDGICYNSFFVNPKSKDKHKEIENFRKWWKEIGLNDEGTISERELGIKKLKEWLSKN